MAEIIIRFRLEPEHIAESGLEITRKIQNALDAGAPKVKEAGRKIGNALNAGIEEGRKRASAEQKERMPSAIVH